MKALLLACPRPRDIAGIFNQIWISGCDVQQRAEADRREVDPPIEVETTSAARLAQLAELLESQAKYNEFKWLPIGSLTGVTLQRRPAARPHRTASARGSRITTAVSVSSSWR
jgi:hypothetical protein